MSFKQLQFERISWLLPISLLLFSYVAQINYDVWRRYSAPKIQTTYNLYIEPQPLSAESSKAISFGAKEFVADLYWLKLIQYYGGGDPNGKYRKPAELFTTITDLSPKFTAAYQTGLLILPGEGFVNEAIALGEKGIKNLPDRWEMPYYTGIVYHIYKKDYLTAGRYFEDAAKLPGAPENAKYLAAIYYNKGDQRQTAYALFKTVYDGTRDSFIKERTAKYLAHLEGIFLLDTKIAEFKQRYNRLPKTLNELISTKLLDGIPVSPLGLTYQYDAENGKIIETK